jgi:hypothetical protein
MSKAVSLIKSTKLASVKAWQKSKGTQMSNIRNEKAVII